LLIGQMDVPTNECAGYRRSTTIKRLANEME